MLKWATTATNSSKRGLDENMKMGTIFPDHWKTFGTLHQRPLLAKFNEYVRQVAAIERTQNYLTGRYQ